MSEPADQQASGPADQQPSEQPSQPTDSRATEPTSQQAIAQAAPVRSGRGVIGVLLGSCALALAVPAMATADVDVWGRPALAVLFLAGVPGVPFAMALKLANPLLTLALGVASSLSFAVLYATLSIVANWWHPIAGAWLSGGLGLACALVALLRHRSADRQLSAAENAQLWIARLDDGRELTVQQTWVVGRRPTTDSWDLDAFPLTVPDRTRSVSKSHFALGEDANGVFVVDLNSTNGVTVTTTDGVSQQCSPGDRVPVGDGSIVSYGEHWLTVRRGRDLAPAAGGPAKQPPRRESVLRAGLATLTRGGRFRAVALGVLGAAALFWWLETLRLPLDRADVLGLLPIVSWRYVVALILLSAVIVSALLRPRVDHLVLTVSALLLAVIGYATVAVADGQGSVPVGWVHVGFVQYISDTGDVPAGVDARFSWPGFFAVAAQLVALAGTRDSSSFLVLAPPAYLALALPALLLIAQFVTRSWRWAWVAIFIFLFTNWYQQDYFSPQATAFVLYVTIIATLLWMIDGARVPLLTGSWWRKGRTAVVRVPGLPPGLEPRTAQALGVVLATLVVGLVAVHQLTPVNLVFSLLAFTVTGLIRYRLLWLMTAVAIGGWFSYGATDFWLGHLDTVLGDLGQVGASVGSSVGERLVGDPTYQRAQFVRIGWSALLFGAGAVGAWFLRRRREMLLLVGLACAPFGLVLVQSYGGEVFIRCFLYASPLLAPLTAVAIRQVWHLARHRSAALQGAKPPTHRSPRWVVALVPLVVVAGLVMTFTRGLNVSFERSPQDQVRAADVLYAEARPGELLGLPLGVGLTPYFLEGSRFPVKALDLECDQTSLQRCLGRPLPRYLLMTITQERTGELLQSRPDGWLWQITDRLVESGQYEYLYTAPEARLLRLVPRPS